MTSSRCNQADSRRTSSQWETSLQSNAVSYCLGANLESALVMIFIEIQIAYSQVVWAKTDHVGCGVRTCTPVYSEDYDILFPWAVYTVCNYGPMWVTTAIVVINDDVTKWKYFSRYWPFEKGIHRSPVDSLHKGQWRGALMFSLICDSTNGRANNRDAGCETSSRHGNLLSKLLSVARYEGIFNADRNGMNRFLHLFWSSTYRLSSHESYHLDISFCWRPNCAVGKMTDYMCARYMGSIVLAA